MIHMPRSKVRADCQGQHSRSFFAAALRRCAVVIFGALPSDIEEKMMIRHARADSLSAGHCRECAAPAELYGEEFSAFIPIIYFGGDRR